MSNKIKQRIEIPYHTRETSNVDFISYHKDHMDEELDNYIRSRYPIVESKDHADDTVLERELFIFNKEELEKFINEYIQSKQYKHEV